MGGSHSVINPTGSNFLGTGGTVLNKPLNAITPLNSGFLGGGTAGRVGQGIATGGLSEYTQQDPYGLGINNPLASVFGNGAGSSNPYISGPFSLDPNQVANDQKNINDTGQSQYDAATKLGTSQYDQLLGGIESNGAAQTQRAKDLFSQMLPNIAENAQAAHLYDSTGYGQEVGRQEANIASQVASDQSQQKLDALKALQKNQSQSLQGVQGFQTGALQRGQSLEDFINQANVAKTIGAQMAPQPPSAKSQFGTVASGVGALAPLAKAVAK